MKTKILLLTAICCTLCTLSISATEQIKVLVITGLHDYNKPAFNAMIKSFEGLECTIKEMNKNPGALFDNISKFPYDVIALYNFNQSMNDKQKVNFLKLFDQGVGLVAMHHSIAGFPDWIEYENLIGATYVLEEQDRASQHYSRPTWKHGVDMQIRIENKDHPITKGLENFSIHDETYKGWIYHDNNHLLLSTENKLSNTQIAWTVPHPNTRVFFIQLGHDQHAFQNKNYKQLITQGIQWAANNN
ncbi:MAG: ThuA domain-containing protein [Kiritimatiellae bacterium]|jgi:type 1 glutamine amidotransferase|nr:ThuA domain-containing protein [Kiritimatiellia bacterium]